MGKNKTRTSTLFNKHVNQCSYNGCPFWDFENSKCLYEVCKLK